MKKFIGALVCGILVLSLMLAGCNDAGFVPENAKELGYIYFPGTDWGMTVDEFYAATGESESDFTISQEESNNRLWIVLIETTNFFNKECQIKFKFISAPHSELATLRTVEVYYPNPMENKEYSEMCEMMDAMIEQQGIPVTISKEQYKYLDEERRIKIELDEPGYDTADALTETFTYHALSKAKTSDLPQEIKEGYDRYIHKLVDIGYYEVLPERWTSGYFADFYREPLSWVDIWRSINYEDGSRFCIITFNGNGIAQPLSYARAVS